MKKNIIVIISIISVLIVVVSLVILMKAPENKVPESKVYTDAVTDVNNDLESINLGDIDKELEAVNKDIQSL